MATVCDKCKCSYTPTSATPRFMIEGTNLATRCADLCWNCRKELEQVIDKWLPVGSNGRTQWTDTRGDILDGGP